MIGNKFLGALLYFKDKDNRGCLKLSFKNKIADFVKGSDVPTTKPVPLKLNDLIKLDISYKFQDSRLEVKRIVIGKPKPEREFYPFSLPPSTDLFTLKIKDWHLLDDAKPSNSPLILTPPESNSVVIVFSFLGTNNRPIKEKEYSVPIMRTIDLPEIALNKFCIGIAEDKASNERNGFVIKIPYNNLKT